MIITVLSLLVVITIRPRLIVVLTDRSRPAVLETDSSDYVNSGILSQADDDGVLYPVIFYSKNLLPAEYNYKIYNKELLIIVRCLEY